MSKGSILKVSGPLVIAEGMRDANLYDVVRVSSHRLIGEIIEMHEDRASIHVYEETSGLLTGEPVESMGIPLSVELGPGLIGSIYDGIQRPLVEIMKIAGNNLPRGIEVPPLNRTDLWHFLPLVSVGEEVGEGDILGTVQETEIVLHKVMVPPGISGVVASIAEGDFTLEQTVCTLTLKSGAEKNLTLMQKWPVRIGRPFIKKMAPNMPLVT